MNKKNIELPIITNKKIEKTSDILADKFINESIEFKKGYKKKTMKFNKVFTKEKYKKYLLWLNNKKGGERLDLKFYDLSKNEAERKFALKPYNARCFRLVYYKYNAGKLNGLFKKAIKGKVFYL